MKKLVTILSAVSVLLLGLDAQTVFAGGVGSLAQNKAYSINVIAHDNCPAGSFDDTSRRTIAVLAKFTDSPDGMQFASIDKTNKIFLTPGADFGIADGNACDGDGAIVDLPTDVSTTYEVYIRLVGKRGSKIDVSTCAEDTTGAVTGNPGSVLCSTDHFVKVRMTGKGEPSFTNATSALLFIINPFLATACNGGKCALFDPSLQNYFWDWNTPLGRPHAQLWFVPIQ